MTVTFATVLMLMVARHGSAVVSAFTDDEVTPGVLGFLVVAALGVATWLLIRSMTRQLRKIDFVDPGDEEADRRTGPPTPSDQPTPPGGDSP
jgi:hypothetical protein